MPCRLFSDDLEEAQIQTWGRGWCQESLLQDTMPESRAEGLWEVIRQTGKEGSACTISEEKARC